MNKETHFGVMQGAIPTKDGQSTLQDTVGKIMTMVVDCRSLSSRIDSVLFGDGDSDVKCCEERAGVPSISDELEEIASDLHILKCILDSVAKKI